MRETGIVRRIDELGRVVIPKEIRKTQRIRTGDSLEIYTDGNGEVIFKKYSPLAELGEPAAVYADVLARRLRCAVAVCDREHIVAAAGAGKGELLGAPLPPEIEPLLTRRKLYTAPASAAEREPLGSRYLLCAAPILVHGDIEGGVLLHGTLREAAPNAEPVNGLLVQGCGPGMPGPYIYNNRETAQSDCDETVKLTKNSEKPLTVCKTGI